MVNFHFSGVTGAGTNRVGEPDLNGDPCPSISADLLIDLRPVLTFCGTLEA
jgi:hypothetical protein